jgi:hypothetical protein
MDENGGAKGGQEYEFLVDVWPGLSDDLSAGHLSLEDLEAAVLSLDGDVRRPVDQAAADFGSDASPVLVPGTAIHVRLPKLSRALLQLAWVTYRGVSGQLNPGDGFSVMSALEALRAAVQRLDVAAGERCAYLAVSTATVRRHLLARVRPDREHVQEALKKNEWCASSCRLHRNDSGVASDDVLASVLSSLTDQKHVLKKWPDKTWSVVI